MELAPLLDAEVALGEGEHAQTPFAESFIVGEEVRSHLVEGSGGTGFVDCP